MITLKTNLQSAGKQRRKQGKGLGWSWYHRLKYTGAFATSNHKIIPEIELKPLYRECELQVLLMLTKADTESHL